MTSSRAVVLVGGASRRMGTDKSLLIVDEQPAAIRLCRLLTEVGFDQVVLVGGSGDRFADGDFPHVVDIEPGRGPLEGVRTALASSSHEWTLVVAVDLHGLNSEAIRTMRDSLIAHPFDDVIHAMSSAGPQPLFGWWRRSTLQTIERELSLGRRSVRSVVGVLRHSTIEFAEGVLRNVNRPEDLG